MLPSYPLQLLSSVGRAFIGIDSPLWGNDDGYGSEAIDQLRREAEQPLEQRPGNPPRTRGLMPNGMNPNNTSKPTNEDETLEKAPEDAQGEKEATCLGVVSLRCPIVFYY